jgi:CheY-like chemotaxis protein
MSTESYEVACFHCQKPFDALLAPWCSCLVTERTVACPHCGHCFCKAAGPYKSRFWSGAPRALWDRKFSAHLTQTDEWTNPEPAIVARPLVLLVDDEADIRRVAISVIDSMGYGLVVGKNGAEGLELAQRYMPDLVLTDALMPKLDGREMCRRLKAEPATAAIKVVVMTSLYTNIKHQNEAFKNFKVDDYLSKPVESTQLRDLLKKHLG